MLSCSIRFSVPSFWLGGGLESRCISRVYDVDVTVHQVGISSYFMRKMQGQTTLKYTGNLCIPNGVTYWKFVSGSAPSCEILRENVLSLSGEPSLLCW